MIGRMRHRVTIQRRTQAQDGVGQPTDTWTTGETVWAAVRPLSGREFYAQSGEHAEITHEVTFRHGVTVAAQDRIVHDSRNLDVVSVINVHERDRFIVARCIENAD